MGCPAAAWIGRSHETRDGGVVHGVGELRVRRGRHCPADDHPVEAAHNGAEIDLAGRYPKLGDVSGPQLVKRIGVEFSLYQVFRSIGYLAFVGALPPFLPRLATKSGSRISLETIFSETLTPSLLGSRWIQR